MSAKKTVTIVRSKWARGKQVPADDYGLKNNALRNSDGTQCCLGFVCRALGSKVAEIAHRSFPSGLKDRPPSWLISLEEEAAKVNDCEDLSARDREKQLRNIFADTPVRLKFVP